MGVSRRPVHSGVKLYFRKKYQTNSQTWWWWCNDLGMLCHKIKSNDQFLSSKMRTEVLRQDSRLEQQASPSVTFYVRIFKKSLFKNTSVRNASLFLLPKKDGLKGHLFSHKTWPGLSNLLAFTLTCFVTLNHIGSFQWDKYANRREKRGG